MRWYADNSELNGIRGAKIPDILLFGGISVSPDAEPILRNKIETAKAEFGPPRIPVKWNFKDLKGLFKRQNKIQLYEELLLKSQEWREAIFRAAKEVDFTIIIACIESNSIKRKVIKEKKATLTRFVFNNGLMRYALHVKECCPRRAEVILDWPDKGDTKPFDTEYACAYNRGKTLDKVQYHSGPLAKLKFHDSAMYTNMNHSTLLQFADLTVGATREFIECSLGKKPYGFGVDMLKQVFRHLKGSPEHVVGWGLSVAGSDDFKDMIFDGVKKHFR